MQARIFQFRKQMYLPHQWEFLQSKATRLCLASGYGGGKTYIFIRKVLKCHIELVNPNTGKSNGWIIYPTYGLAEDLFIADFIDLLEKLQINYHYNKSEYTIKTHYGKIKIHSLQNPTRIVGGNLTYVGADEFDVESSTKVLATYNKAIARLRGCDNAPFFTVSTAEGYKALYQIFFETPSPEKHLIHAKSTDNPYLPSGYVESLRNDYDALMQLQYIDGMPQNLNGSMAYYTFDRMKQVIPCKNLDTQINGQYQHQLWIGMDFNVMPMTATARIMIDGKSYCIKEYWLQSGNTRNMCINLKEDYPDRPIICCPDMTGDHNSTNASRTDLDILKEFGFEIRGKRHLLQKDRLNVVNNAHDKGLCFYDISCKRLVMDRERVIMIDNHIDKSEEGAPNYRTHLSDADDYAIYQQFTPRKEWRTR